QRVTPNLEFEAPRGAGLDGVTDVAIVMANAMSRLAEERPELRTEFAILQRTPPSATNSQTVTIEHRPARRPGPAPPPPPSPARAADAERPARRRRRRRRRGRRHDGAFPEIRSVRDEASETLLQQVEKVMADAGPRSLHI